jgi:glycosyltransferase involved in cell wall biosynthesis
VNLILVTGEFPPYSGGIADYTAQVARALRERGHSVQVIALRSANDVAPPEVHFVGSPSSPRTYERLKRIVGQGGSDTAVVVQYESRMYGFEGLNVVFALQIAGLRHIWLAVMFHELFDQWNQEETAARTPLRHRVLAAVTKRMCSLIARRADYCFASTAAYGDALRPFVREGVPIEWLPVPSNIPTQVNPQIARVVKERLTANCNGPLIGHFASYSPLLRSFVEKAAWRFPEWRFVFIGRGSVDFCNELVSNGVLSHKQGIASGDIPHDEVSCWIDACDVMLQPYPEGASTRRGSLMAALGLGKATVTNLGSVSEPFWESNESLVVVETLDIDRNLDAVAKIIAEPHLRDCLEANAARLYEERFHLRHTVARIEAVCVNASRLSSPCRTSPIDNYLTDDL